MGSIDRISKGLQKICQGVHQNDNSRLYNKCRAVLYDILDMLD